MKTISFERLYTNQLLGNHLPSFSLVFGCVPSKLSLETGGKDWEAPGALLESCMEQTFAALFCRIWNRLAIPSNHQSTKLSFRKPHKAFGPAIEDRSSIRSRGIAIHLWGIFRGLEAPASCV